MTEEEEWWLDYQECRNRLESATRWGFLGGIIAMIAGNFVRELYGVWWSLLAFGVIAIVATVVLVRHEQKLALELVGEPPVEHERLHHDS